MIELTSKQWIFTHHSLHLFLSEQSFKYPDEEHHRPAVPAPSDRPLMGLKTTKNFITTNAVENITSVPKKAEKIYVDTKKGDKHKLETSGLEPIYVKKKVSVGFFGVPVKMSFLLFSFLLGTSSNKYYRVPLLELVFFCFIKIFSEVPEWGKLLLQCKPPTKIQPVCGIYIFLVHGHFWKPHLLSHRPWPFLLEIL